MRGTWAPNRKSNVTQIAVQCPAVPLASLLCLKVYKLTVQGGCRRDAFYIHHHPLCIPYCSRETEEKQPGCFKDTYIKYIDSLAWATGVWHYSRVALISMGVCWLTGIRWDSGLHFHAERQAIILPVLADVWWGLRLSLFPLQDKESYLWYLHLEFL